jgi:hypothetical protein
MDYTVKYKHKCSFFWHTIKNCKGDGIMADVNYPMRYFILSDESRIEIPLVDMIFEFSKERYYLIKENMNKEIGKV